jgi:thiol-disulfide isomerase/thioredoxin
MKIDVIEFGELERELAKTQKSPIDFLAPEIGKVYVIAITRDGCPACEKQKPKLNDLASTIAEKHGDKVVFTRIHIKYARGSEEESLRSKDVLGHYFYPTNLILLRTTDRGAIEFYKNAAPDMDELEKNIEHALEVAAMFEKETA